MVIKILWFIKKCKDIGGISSTFFKKTHFLKDFIFKQRTWISENQENHEISQCNSERQGEALSLSATLPNTNFFLPFIDTNRVTDCPNKYTNFSKMNVGFEKQINLKNN